MDFFNKFLKGKNQTNETDNGLIFNEPTENRIIEEKLKILKQFENKKNDLININKEELKTKYISNQIKKDLIYNFISLINENSETKINLVKYSLNAAIDLGNKIMYLISFYTEFSDTNHIRPFNIFFITILDKNDTQINLIDKISYIDILGTKPASDISFGTDYNLLKGKLINIFKEEPLEMIYNQSKINNYLNQRENITKDKYERGFPPKKFETIEPLLLESNDKIKIQIGEKCLNDENNKVVMVNCNRAKKYKYNNKNIINENNYCLSYHHDEDISFVPCDITEKCGEQSDINNCKTIKFRKYGSFEIDKLDKCLDEDLKIKDCIDTKKIKIY